MDMVATVAIHYTGLKFDTHETVPLIDMQVL